MIQGKTEEIQNLNKKVKELQEQLKKGTTPQIEGLNLEERLGNTQAYNLLLDFYEENTLC